MFSVVLFVSFSDHLPSLFKTLKKQADCTTLMKMCSQYAGTFSAGSRTVPTGVSWPRDCVFCVNGLLLTEFENLRVDASPPPIKGEPSRTEPLLGCPLHETNVSHVQTSPASPHPHQ